MKSITAGTMSIVILAILVGLVAAYAFRMATMKDEIAQPAPPPFVSVPLASTDLPAGRLLGMGDISLLQLTREQVSEQYAEKLSEMMMASEQIIGRIIRKEIPRGQPFLTGDLYLEGEYPDVSELLKPGFRAVNLTIPNLRKGMFRPGTHVDVLFRVAARPAEENQLAIPETTVTLLSDAEVLTVEQPRPLAPPVPDDESTLVIQRDRSRNGSDGPTSVTLAVTPHQANVLQTAQGRGELSLLPRSAQDQMVNAADPSNGLTLEDVLGIKGSSPVVYQTEVYLRGDRSVNTFDGPMTAPPDSTVTRARTIESTPVSLPSSSTPE